MTATYLSNTAALAPSTPAVQTKPRSLFRRIYETVAFAQQRRAEREIARFIAARGGRFSDAAEREIEQHFLSPRIF